VVREKRLNCLLECKICPSGVFYGNTGTLRAAAVGEESCTNEQAEEDQGLPEILVHHVFLQWQFAARGVN
jgi:hypothetical protein